MSINKLSTQMGLDNHYKTPLSSKKPPSSPLISPQRLMEELQILKLYEVTAVGNDFLLKRIRITTVDTDRLEKIHHLIHQLHEGKVWLKTGKKHDKVYAAQGLDLEKIGKIFVERRNKYDPSEPGRIDEIESERVREMSSEDVALLENIAGALESVFGNELQIKEDKLLTSEKKQPIPKKQVKKASSKKVVKEPKTSTTRSSTKNKKKDLVQAERLAVEDHRTKQRKNEKLSKELDEKFSQRLRKDIKLENRHQEIARNDHLKEEISSE